ncbi:MAG TPA: L-threonylcarbamoyladenylate synthase [Phycisphaerae bacterium]|nr:L-threonylcarbamoyladenylate synthase [Phycisphaerae bacterium]
METRTVTIGDASPDDEQIREAGAALARGELIVFPTETVYGLGASALGREAIDAMNRLKNRQPGKPFTLHLPDPEQARTYAGTLSPVALRLIRRAWPGPLTLVLPDRRENPGRPEGLFEAAIYHRGTVGLRCPDHAVGRAILRAAGVPVVGTSANLAGQPPPRTAPDALAQLDGRVPLVVDAGPARHAGPSTVVRVQADDSYQVLREGAVSDRRLARLARTCLLFVCTGNMCRSPMAVGLARKILADRLDCTSDDLDAHGFEITSAGTACAWGGPASDNAIRVMAERGIDLARHRSRPMTVDALAQADYIWVMTGGHREAAIRHAPAVAAKVSLVDPAGREVSDPIGGNLEVYRTCARHLEQALAHRLAEVV